MDCWLFIAVWSYLLAVSKQFSITRNAWVRSTSSTPATWLSQGWEIPRNHVFFPEDLWIEMWDFRLPCLITWGDLILQQKKSWDTSFPQPTPSYRGSPFPDKPLGTPREFSMNGDCSASAGKSLDRIICIQVVSDHGTIAGWCSSHGFQQAILDVEDSRCYTVRFFFFATGIKKIVFAIFTSWCLLVEFLLIPTRFRASYMAWLLGCWNFPLALPSECL